MDKDPVDIDIFEGGVKDTVEISHMDDNPI